MDKKEIKDKAASAFDKETYENIIKKLSGEKERLEGELVKEYRNARHYVRTHPEQGIGVSFLGGLVVGFIIAKILED